MADLARILELDRSARPQVSWMILQAEARSPLGRKNRLLLTVATSVVMVEARC